MNLENKTVLIMGIRNKWSIAWGAAMEAHKNGAKNIVFTFNPTDGGEKLLELISEIPGSKAFPCDASSDESIKEALESVKSIAQYETLTNDEDGVAKILERL